MSSFGVLSRNCLLGQYTHTYTHTNTHSYSDLWGFFYYCQIRCQEALGCSEMIYNWTLKISLAYNYRMLVIHIPNWLSVKKYWTQPVLYRWLSRISKKQCFSSLSLFWSITVPHLTRLVSTDYSVPYFNILSINLFSKFHCYQISMCFHW